MTLIGEVDMAAIADLHHHLVGILAADDSPDLFIDLGLVTFLDSSGLAFLVTTHNTLQWKGGRLTIVGATPQIRRLVEISGLIAILKVAPS
jgi:stage II sporulation protein AA (anti-sigma F factor antagonist)